MKDVQQMIRDLREYKSQEEIAVKVQASQSLISRWEAGAIPAAAEITLRLVSMHRSVTAMHRKSGMSKPLTKEE